MTDTRRPKEFALPLTPLAVALSLLFSLIVIVQNPLLNDDAYGYLRAAEAFSATGLRAVMESYGWYGYSIMIALLDRVLPGDGISAAHTLNTALYALLTWVFIRLSGELRGGEAAATQRLKFFAALCILVFPLINEMRYFLIRDTGFWAFALLSVVFLIRYRSSGTLRAALYWCLALCAAALFRLEALVLLALVPFSLLFPCATLTYAERLRRLLRLLAVLVAVVAIILLAAFAANLDLVALIAYAYRYYFPALGELIPQLTAAAAEVGAVMFTPDNFPGEAGTAHGLVALLLGNVLALLTNLVNALSLPVVVFILYYRLCHSPLLLAPAASRVLVAYIGAAMLALLLFVTIMHFLTQRYATLLSLLILSLVPAMLDDLYTRAQARGAVNRFRYILACFCLYFVVESLVSFGYSQRHVEAGIAWVQSELPADAVLKTNNFAIAYHSGRVADYDKTVRDSVRVVADSVSGDYLVLEVDRDEDGALEANSRLQQLQLFANERGDEVRVYRYR